MWDLVWGMSGFFSFWCRRGWVFLGEARWPILFGVVKLWWFLIRLVYEGEICVVVMVVLCDEGVVISRVGPGETAPTPNERCLRDASGDVVDNEENRQYGISSEIIQMSRSFC